MFAPSPFAVPAQSPAAPVAVAAPILAPARTARRPAAPPALPEIATAAELEQQAVGQGYVAGFNPVLPPAARETDLKMAKRMRCPSCHCRGLEARPHHRIKNGMAYGYRVICACPKCGAGEVA